MAELKYLYGLGRRKSATASARLFKGKGSVIINDKPAVEYFSNNKTHVAEITDPLALVNKQEEFDITILVKGGGIAGQVDAIKLAIAKAITVGHADLRSTLKKAEFLKRDSREKERKKYGLRSARKKEQFSKR
jgi:small subunit ribosomal protein S9